MMDQPNLQNPPPSPPCFDGSLQINQSAPTPALLTFIALASAFACVILTMYIGIELAGLPEFIVFFIAIFMVLLGAGIPILIRERLYPSESFNGESNIVIDSHGINIEKIGQIDWENVLSLESIPDSSSTILIHTTNQGELLLSDTPANMSSKILPALEIHFGSETETSFAKIYRVTSFNWPRFQFLILLGYVAACTIGVLGAIYGTSLLKSVVVALIVPPMVAYLIWMFPLWGLSFGRPRRVIILKLRNAQLVFSNGKPSFDLTEAAVSLMKKTGLAYSIEFVTLTLKDGTKHYFLPYDNSWDSFVAALKSASYHG